MNKEGTNIEYWQKVLNEPRQAYKEWFEVEEKYLLENTVLRLNLETKHKDSFKAFLLV